MEELQKAVDLKATNKTQSIDIFHSIGKIKCSHFQPVYSYLES